MGIFVMARGAFPPSKYNLSVAASHAMPKLPVAAEPTDKENGITLTYAPKLQRSHSPTMLKNGKNAVLTLGKCSQDNSAIRP